MQYGLEQLSVLNLALKKLCPLNNLPEKGASRLAPCYFATILLHKVSRAYLAHPVLQSEIQPNYKSDPDVAISWLEASFSSHALLLLGLF